MISDYFTKYCSYYLSRYSITEKKFENILKRKIKKDFFNKKFTKNDYFQYLNEIEKVLLYYKNIGFFKEESLIDGKIDSYIRKGYSKKTSSKNKENSCSSDQKDFGIIKKRKASFESYN